MAESTSENVEEVATAKQVAEVSLRNFAASGYKRTSWEVAAGAGPRMLFEPMSLEVLESEVITEESFYEDLGQYLPKKGAIYSAPQKVATVEVAHEQGPALEEKLRMSFEEGKLAGIEQGRLEAAKELQAKFEEENSKKESISQAIQQQLVNFFAETEKKALQFSLEVSRELVEATAEAKPEYILEIIRKGLRATGSATPIRIRVSVADFEFLQIEGMPSDLTSQELGIEYVADDSVKSGCVIETNYGDVDLQLNSMWEQLRENLREVFE